MQDKEKQTQVVIPARPLGAILDAIKTNPTIAFSLAYLWVSSIGFAYNWALFNHFSINIMDFVGANDLLFAAFKNISTIVMFSYGVALLSVFITILQMLLKLLSHAGSSKSKPAIESINAFIIVLTVSLSIAYTGFVPEYVAKRAAAEIKNGEKEEYLVSLRGMRTNSNALKPVIGQFIGATEKFIFIYMTNDKYVKIIPVSNIAMIDVLPKKCHADSAS